MQKYNDEWEFWGDDHHMMEKMKQTLQLMNAKGNKKQLARNPTHQSWTHLVIANSNCNHHGTGTREIRHRSLVFAIP